MRGRWAIALTLFCACGRSSSSTDAAADAALPLPVSCHALRACIDKCGSVPGCAQRCEAMAPAEARGPYQAVESCTAKLCASDDLPCICGTECYATGACSELLEACLQGADDGFCNDYCH